MSQRVVQGNPVTLSAYYRNGAGALVTPADPFVSILDPAGAVVVSLATPTEIVTGFFQYVYNVPVAAEIGGWSAQWFGEVDDAAVDDEDVFTVITPGMVDAGTTFVTVDDLENYMQRQLNTTQRTAASVLITEVIAEAEDKMGQAIGAQIWEEDIIVEPLATFVPVRYGPIQSVSSVVFDGTTLPAGSYEFVTSGIVLHPWWSPPVPSDPSILFPHMTVTYTGGITTPRKVTTLANVIKGRVARVLLTAMNQAIGLQSISVESYTASLVEDDWTEREKRILGTRRSPVRGQAKTSPATVFNDTWYGVDEV